MNALRYAATTLTCGLMLAAVTSYAFASERRARAGFDARAEAVGSELAARVGDRVSALRECNSKSATFTEYAWGNWEFNTYRACMAERGQPE